MGNGIKKKKMGGKLIKLEKKTKKGEEKQVSVKFNTNVKFVKFYF